MSTELEHKLGELEAETTLEDMESDSHSHDIIEGKPKSPINTILAGALLALLAVGGTREFYKQNQSNTDTIKTEKLTPEKIAEMANQQAGLALAQRSDLDKQTATALACGMMGDPETKRLCLAAGLRKEEGFIVATGKSKINLDTISENTVVYADDESAIDTHQKQIETLEAQLKKLQEEYDKQKAVIDSKKSGATSEELKAIKNLNSQIIRLNRYVKKLKSTHSDYKVRGQFTAIVRSQ